MRINKGRAEECLLGVAALCMDMNAFRPETFTIDENTNPQIQAAAEFKQNGRWYKDLDTWIQSGEDWGGGRGSDRFCTLAGWRTVRSADDLRMGAVAANERWGEIPKVLKGEERNVTL